MIRFWIIYFIINTLLLTPKVYTASLTLEHLRSLPYLGYTREKVDKKQIGVMKYIVELSFDGYNYYGGYDGCSEEKTIDMQGDSVAFRLECIRGINIRNLLVRRNEYIVKYDSNGNVVWVEGKLPCHHDFTISDDNTILALSTEKHKYKGRDIIFDVIMELSCDGDILSRWSTYENLNYLRQFHGSSPLDKQADPNTVMHEEDYGDYDYYHMNSIQILPATPIGKEDKRFQKGNWLISLSETRLVLILDKKTRKIVWHWSADEIEDVHMPRMLNNGNILILDNGDRGERDFSRVIELNPANKEIVWEYTADPPETFFTDFGGSAQRLPNGNTLITETEKGRVFEITKNKEIVWEWFNPKINEEGKRETVYRMLRLPKEKIDNFMYGEPWRVKPVKK